MENGDIDSGSFKHIHQKGRICSKKNNLLDLLDHDDDTEAITKIKFSLCLLSDKLY